MPTFFKIVLIGVLVAVLLHFWPVIMATSVFLGIVAAAVLVFGGGAISVCAGILLAIAGGLAAAFAFGLAILSPIWLPLVALAAIIALLRDSTPRRVAP